MERHQLSQLVYQITRYRLTYWFLVISKAGVRETAKITLKLNTGRDQTQNLRIHISKQGGKDTLSKHSVSCVNKKALAVEHNTARKYRHVSKASKTKPIRYFSIQRTYAQLSFSNTLILLYGDEFFPQWLYLVYVEM